MTQEIQYIKRKIKRSITRQGVDLDKLSLTRRLERMRNQKHSFSNFHFVLLLFFVIAMNCINVPAHEQTQQVQGRITSLTYFNSPTVYKVRKSPYKNQNKIKFFKSPYVQVPPPNLSQAKRKPEISYPPAKVETHIVERKQEVTQTVESVQTKTVDIIKQKHTRKKKLKINLKQMLGSDYPVTSEYGYRTDPVPHRRMRIRLHQHHNGIDIGVPVGTPIYSPEDGYISNVHYRSCSGGGKKIYLDHYNGYQTVYMHLSKIIIGEGQYVKKGELLGYTGMSGFRVTGPHLHFEIRKDGFYLNPRKLLEN